MAQRIPIYIPTYINSAEYTPARVLPRLLFYNGLLDCETYYLESGSLAFGGVTYEQTSFPYFDNYNVVSGSFPTTDSLSLLFNNEGAAYGEVPTENLYTEYWETYISLLYNPYTRLVNCSAIIPLADYFQLELNDIVNFRGNYFHLRAINDYSLKTGECNLQLLGPIVGTTFAQDFANTPTTTTTAAPTTTTTTISGSTTTTTTFSPDPCICTEVVITSSGGEVATTNCYGVNQNYVYFSAGTYYLCAASIGGLLQAFITAGTGTVSPVGNCKTGTCPPASTTTTTAGTTTTTTAGTTTTTTAGTTTTTTFAPGCYLATITNNNTGTTFIGNYVYCGTIVSQSYSIASGTTATFCTQDRKIDLPSGPNYTSSFGPTNGCAATTTTTTTLAPGCYLATIINNNIGTSWIGDYVYCGNNFSQSFLVASGTSASFCTQDQKIDLPFGTYYTSSFSAVGGCAATTTTTTTLAPGCYLATIVNNNIGTTWIGQYVYCGTSVSQSFSVASGTSASFCTQDQKIDLPPYASYYTSSFGPVGGCAATTTTTTTLAPGCYLATIINNNIGTSWVGDYVYCGASVSQSFLVASGTSASFCTQDQKIDLPSGPDYTSSFSVVGGCAATTTTTTTLAPGCYLATIVNNNTGTTWIGEYVYCGNNFSQSFSVASGTSASFCTQDQKIDLPPYASYYTSSFGPVGGCAATTTTTTTLAPGCYLATIINNNTGTSFIGDYVYCGSAVSQSYTLASGTSASFCTQDKKIDLPSGPNYTSSFSVVGGCAATTTTTTTLAPGCYSYNIINNSTDSTFIGLYVECGTNYTASYSIPSQTTASLCVLEQKINLPSGTNYTSSFTGPGTCVGTTTTTSTTTTTAGPTTTTTVGPTTTTTTSTTTTTTTAGPTTTTTTSAYAFSSLISVTDCATETDFYYVSASFNTSFAGDDTVRFDTPITGLYCWKVINFNLSGSASYTRNITDVYPGPNGCPDCSE